MDIMWNGLDDALTLHFKLQDGGSTGVEIVMLGLDYRKGTDDAFSILDARKHASDYAKSAAVDMFQN